MDLGIAGKVALVTGGSRGIGRAIALALAGEGARVVLCARGGADLEAAVAEARARGGSPDAALGVVADVTTDAGAAALVDAAVRAHGGVDIVVNNVGGSGARDFAATDEADLRAVLDRNLFPALRVSRAALPHLKARGGGVIILIASIYGRESGGGPSYNVAKAAEISLAKAMARDLARDAIRVVSVAPGSILFPGGGWERRQKADPEGIAAFVAREIPFGRFGRPEEVGDVVAFLCSARAGWITGACIPVDGGQSRAF
jgi:3-oxoacyl-[acyl-carrier protein] reductase